MGAPVPAAAHALRHDAPLVIILVVNVRVVEHRLGRRRRLLQAVHGVLAVVQIIILLPQPQHVHAQTQRRQCAKQALCLWGL